ncbi:MAG: MFS transporter, partial [Lachnospiraceae bacterium]|nr:MFS transporter [Lachnospiraceae bacterium]
MSKTAVREPQKQSLVNRDFILMMLVNVCLSVGFYFFQPVLPGYITSMGISITVAGIIAGLFSFTALVARPFTGLLSDRIS